MKPFSLKFWRKFLAKEWFPILISLVLSVVLWYNVGGEQTVDTSVMIPVEVINLPRDLVISNQFKKQIEVTVNGPRTLILDIDNKQITRQIDLSKATPGTTVVSNDIESIEVPRGLTVLRVQPSTIILSLDKLIQKKFPVNPVTAGNPRPGYILQDLRMDPEVITVTGPETVLSQYDVFRTKVININNLSKSTQQQIPLDLEPAIVDLIGETTITADISIALQVVPMEFELPLETSIKGLKVKKVKILANIPKILLDQNVKPQDLVSARVMEDAENGVGIVRVVQTAEMELPVEVIQVDPAIVELPVQPAAPENAADSKETDAAPAPSPEQSEKQ